MVSFYRGNNHNKLTEHGDRVRYIVQGDTFERYPDGTVGGFPVGRISLDYEKGTGTTPNFDNSDFAKKHYKGYSEEHYYRNGGAPTELFHTDPEKIVVSSAYAHPKLRKHIPKLLAIAQMDNPEHKLTASPDMTEYSARLARNAVKKGLALPHPQNPNMENNGVEISPEDDLHHSYTMLNPEKFPESMRIPEKDILKGEQFLRVALGRGPKTEVKPEVKPEPKYEQPRLPGME